MKKGVIVEYGTAAQIIRAPRDEYTKKLIDAVPDFSSLIARRPTADVNAAVNVDTNTAGGGR
ncbi:MAG: hypothetical protein CBARDMAM_5330 [uncultured Caballeronia sp.]|nr:MAG: hypothetical protein CBARDMAM_5330 [uncultured Caballeronia sp.]